MADDGKSIADAYRNWSGDSATAAPSEGASIVDAYRTQDVATPPPPAMFPPAKPPEADAPPWMMQSDIANALQPAPNTTYASAPWMWVARDDKTGQLRFAMPSSIRDVLTGNLGVERTMDPGTGQISAGTPTAGANLLLSSAVPALRFSGDTPLQFVPPGTFDAKPPLSPQFTASPMAAELEARLRGDTTAGAGRTSGGGTGPAPQPTPTAAPGPQPVATPTTAPRGPLMPINTAAKADAEADRILQHFAGDQPVVINSAPLASGAQPTLSQSIEGGNAGLAALERGVRDVPEQTQHFVARETGNTALRNKAVGDVIGDSRATDVTEEALNQRTRPQEAAIFDPAKTKPVDPSDTVAAIDDVLKGPQGQRDVVKESLQHVRDKLVDKDGNLQTDPAQLRGVDLSIGDMIGPKAAGTAHDGRMAAHQLMGVRDNLRGVIEQGAPGYQDFLAQQAQERSAIDGQRFLQARNITDRQGNVNLGTLDATIKAAERQQQMPGARLADGVTDEQLDRLRQLRADYQNDAKQRLGVSIGSPTVQKLGVSGSMAVMGHPLLAGAAGTAGAWAAGLNPLLGAAVGGTSYLMRLQSAKGQRMVMDALRAKLLDPDLAKSAFGP